MDYLNLLVSLVLIIITVFFGKKKKVKQIELSKKEAAEAGDVHAQLFLARCYYYGTNGYFIDKKKSFHWFEKASDQGHPEGMNGLAYMYDFGISTEVNRDKAVCLYTLASAKGNAEAKHNLATMYFDGQFPLDKNEDKAFQLFSEAAALGHVDAMVNIGGLYEQGKGTDININLAKHWYTQSKDHSKSAEALVRLAMF